MRPVVIVLAAVVSVVALVEGRRVAREVKKNVARTNRTLALEHAAGQKPGQVTVPKLPKIKRAG
ncbi:MAG: hypothetical protein JWP75_3140 [Frondihabitans sp.]|nr:hypothetical protein [Frondihabitans sp.]